MSCTQGVKVSLRTCTFACLTVCVCVIFSVYLIVMTARESILVSIGMVTSVVSCVSVSSRRFDWPSVALCRATSPLSLWEWQAYTESCPGVTASSQLHNWLTLLICFYSLSNPWIIIPLYKKDWYHKTVTSILFFSPCLTVKSCIELTCLYAVNVNHDHSGRNISNKQTLK